jgi:hypothetical protein
LYLFSPESSIRYFRATNLLAVGTLYGSDKPLGAQGQKEHHDEIVIGISFGQSWSNYYGYKVVLVGPTPKQN